MNISSSRVRLFGFGAALFSGAAAVIACGGSTADGGEGDPDSGIVLPNDAGQSVDATAPSDASAPTDAGPAHDAATAVDAGVITADLATDFTATANPNGAWKYGYSIGAPGGDASAIIVYPSKNQPVTDVDCWYDENNVSLGAPAACHNTSAATTSTGVAPGEAALHPGHNGEYSIARWTAPRSGAYVVHVQFKAGDTGETDGMLVHNDVVLYSVAATSTNPTDDRTVTMAAGDTLDVAVGNDGDYLFDTTPVIFTIHSAP